MKNSHRCPKCGSEEIVCCKSIENGRYDKIPVGLLGVASINRWICCACGYCELWADEWDLQCGNLEKLKKKWASPETEKP